MKISEETGSAIRDWAGPKIVIQDMKCLDYSEIPVVTAEQGKRLTLSFDLLAETDFREPIVNICLCREHVVIAGSSSAQLLEGLSLSAGQRVNVHVRYEDVMLSCGKYTAVIYALPTRFSSSKTCLSDYHESLVIEGPRVLVEAYIVLPQSWSMEPAVVVAERLGT